MPTAVVTGASSGIGRAFAADLAASGHDLILVARRADRLDAVAEDLRSRNGVRCQPVTADLSARAGVERVVEVARHESELSVLVANAGTTLTGRAGTLSADEVDALIELLAGGVIHLVESLVGPMVERGRGDIVVVSSVAALIPMPKSAVYAAAKAAATSYARSLHRELRGTGVRVTSVNPGYVRTDLHEAAGLVHLARRIPDRLWVEPEAVVASAQRALRRGRAVAVPGLIYRMSLPFLASAPAQALWARMTKR